MHSKTVVHNRLRIVVYGIFVIKGNLNKTCFAEGTLIKSIGGLLSRSYVQLWELWETLKEAIKVKDTT